MRFRISHIASLNTSCRSFAFKSKSTVEYIYGASVVIPALETKKRRIQKLLVSVDTFHGSIFRKPVRNAQSVEKEGSAVDIAIELAMDLEIPIQEYPRQKLDTLTENKPNQGLALMTAPFNVPMIKSLGPFSPPTIDEPVTYIAKETNTKHIDFMLNTRRAFPLWLALDRVVDPQNLGAIIRTAYFFGVDGVVITDKESAPLNPTVSKASSGAMEVMDIFKTSSISKFIQESSEAGWYIYGTDLKGGPEKSLVIDPTYETPSLLHSPTILVMGNEGIGLRSSVTKLCDKHLILKSEREEEMTTSKYQIDSLNVSVAAGILIQRILDS